MKIRPTTPRLRALLAFASIVAMLSTSPAFAQRGKPKSGGGYQLLQLDTSEGMATGIHQQAGVVEIVGVSYADATAVYWVLNSDGDVVMSVDLNTTAGQTSGAIGLNRQGVIVGWHHNGDIDNSTRPLVWKDFATDPVELTVPEGFSGFAQGTAVNDNLLVVGNLISETGQHSIIAWQLEEVDGVLVISDAITVASGTQSGQPRLNNQGYLAATLDSRACRWRVVWNPDVGESGGLEVVSTETLFDTYSYATDINEAGTVCGEVNIFEGGHAAFAMTLDGSLLDLPLLDVNKKKQRTENVAANAINNTGQVAGTADVISQRSGIVEQKPAVLWSLGENATELPLQTWSAGLYALDDMGWAVGHALDVESGLWLPVLLKP